VDELAQLLVWLLLIALAVVAISHGPGAVKQWWKAKFLGQV
jgi:hypothetical protein